MNPNLLIVGGVDETLNVFAKQNIGHFHVRKMLHNPKCFNFKNGLMLWYESPDSAEIEEVNAYMLKEYGVEIIVHKTCSDWQAHRDFIMGTKKTTV